MLASSTEPCAGSLAVSAMPAHWQRVNDGEGNEHRKKGSRSMRPTADARVHVRPEFILIAAEFWQKAWTARVHVKTLLAGRPGRFWTGTTAVRGSPSHAQLALQPG